MQEPVQDFGTAATISLEMRLRQARESFSVFSQFVMRDEVGNSIQWGPIHYAINLHIEHCWATGINPGVLAPYSHGKSVAFVVGRAAYEIGRNPNLRMKLICNNDARAMERAQGVASIIRSDAYRLVFPGIRPVTREEVRKGGRIAKWTQHQIYVARDGSSIDPSIHAAGVVTQGTGGRSDLNFYDDVVDQENAINKPEMRRKVSGNFRGVWLQRLEATGRSLFVGTPYHDADLVHELQNHDSWSVLKIAVSEDFQRLEMSVTNPTDGYPLPVRHSQLRRERPRRIDSHVYAESVV